MAKDDRICVFPRQGSPEDPYHPRWLDIADPSERQCAHIIDLIGYLGHYMHAHGGGRSGRAPLLCALLKNGGEMPQREFMGRFELKAGSLSEVLTKIEKDGLIERRRDERDRRQLIVRLTEEGRAQAVFEQAKREKFRAEALATITPEQRDALEDMLVSIKEQWRSIDD